MQRHFDLTQAFSEGVELDRKEQEILQTLKQCGVHAESVSEVDPYMAIEAAKNALLDLSTFTEIGERVISATDSNDEVRKEEALLELRALLMFHKLQYSSAITPKRFTHN